MGKIITISFHTLYFDLHEETWAGNLVSAFTFPKSVDCEGPPPPPEGRAGLTKEES